MRTLRTALRRFAAAQSGMAPVEYVVLSAVIGLVLFGSAIALGFPASTGFPVIGGSSNVTAYGSLSVPDSDVSHAVNRSDEIPTDNPGALPESTTGVSTVSGYVSSGSPWSGMERGLDAGVHSTPDPANDAKAEVPVAAASVSNRASGASAVQGVKYGGAPSGAAASGFSAPIARPGTAKPAGAMRLAFESSKSAGDASARRAEVLLGYPIPPVVPDSHFEAAEDPLLTAALDVPHGKRRAQDGPIGMVHAAYSAENFPRPAVEIAAASMWTGAAAESLDLSRDDLMLLSMVAGLIFIAGFLWLASVWLTDRAAIKRQKMWEREKAEALALTARLDADGREARAA